MITTTEDEVFISITRFQEEMIEKFSKENTSVPYQIMLSQMRHEMQLNM